MQKRARSQALTKAGVLFSTEEIASRDLDVTPFVQKAMDATRHGALRVAVPMPLMANLAEIATWEALPDGGNLWRLRVNSEGAIFLSMKLSAFELPKGAELHFASVHRDFYDGPYTHRHNARTGYFLISALGSTAIVWSVASVLLVLGLFFGSRHWISGAGR